MTVRSAIFVSLLLPFFFCIAVFAENSGGYAGAEACKACHEQQCKNIEASPHARINFLNGNAGRDCESCHGPGAAHIEGGGDKSKIFIFQAANRKDASQRCLTCHAARQEQSGFMRSSHFRNDVACLDCHSVHQPAEPRKLLAARPNDLCFRCHSDLQAEFAKPSHHRVTEGLVSCSDCHNVHGAAKPKQLRAAAGGDDVCFKCHRDKQGPFVFEHLPVKTEGCTACHTPHGSSNPKLLARSQANTLCTECHGISTLPSLHNQSAKYSQCTVCHVAIHGSNTSNVLFKF